MHDLIASTMTQDQIVEKKKMKILCLHGFRTSGAFLKKQISKWDPSIFAHFDLDFPDGGYPAGDKSDIEGIFPPPYFEWFQFEKEFTVYFNLDECISRLCDYITTNGPFHGLLGFSQGTSLAGLLLGYQAQGKLLKDHPPFKLFMAVSGSKFRAPSICDVAYKDPINVKSVHFIGEKDWLKLPSEDLASAFVDPVIIRHPQGHTVPRLDEATVEKMRAWIAAVVADGEVVGTGVNGKEHVSDHPEAEEKEKAAPAEAEDGSSKAATETESSIAIEMETVVGLFVGTRCLKQGDMRPATSTIPLMLLAICDVISLHPFRLKLLFHADGLIHRKPRLIQVQKPCL